MSIVVVGTGPEKGPKVQQLPIEDRYEINVDYSEEDGAFVALVPAMPFVGGHGDTSEEALAMAKSAIRTYIETAQELGKPIPEPTIGIEQQRSVVPVRRARTTVAQKIKNAITFGAFGK